MSSQLGYYEFMGFDSAELRRRYAGYADRYQPGEHVLDIGCGRGEFLELLQARGAQGLGIDADDGMVGASSRPRLERSSPAAVSSSLPRTRATCRCSSRTSGSTCSTSAFIAPRSCAGFSMRRASATSRSVRIRATGPARRLVIIPCHRCRLPQPEAGSSGR
ncbi:MAG: class I SAM-dependent methyltransferase [Chloroflexi bacterium]|nr:MAG: class I SAM-dependent methyltransferase [Chloroflexota bacterium]